jgi:hypothetical protein
MKRPGQHRSHDKIGPLVVGASSGQLFVGNKKVKKNIFQKQTMFEMASKKYSR